MLHIRLFGNFSITHHEQPVAALTRLQLKSLLAYLTLHHQTLTPRDTVALLLSPASDVAQAKTNLRKLLFELRQKFPAIERYLAITDNTIGWKPGAAVRFDVAEFEAALQLADQAPTAGLRQAALTQALACYTGDLWPDCREEWVIPERERLSGLYVEVLEQLIDLLELQRDYTAALQAAHRLLRHNPLREESYRRIMRLYACLGERAGIEGAFQECRMLLARKLQVAPSQPTRELYERLLQAVAVAPPAAMLPFIERHTEWAHLHQAWASARQGQPRCLLFTGAAGMGKTRLLTEFTLHVERQGWPVIALRCHPFTLEIAYAPLLDWVRSAIPRRRIATLAPLWRNELARLLPDLELEATSPPLTSPPLTSPLESGQRLYEALTHLCLPSTEPLLLVIDDVQWCDQATIGWLYYLLHTTPGARLLLVATLSPLELRPHYPLTIWRSRLQQCRLATEFPLSPLTAPGVAALGSAILGEPLSATASAALYEATEGNPLYVGEALRSGALPPPDAISATLLQSPIVQATLQLATVPLSAAAQELLGLAAAIGRSFTLDLLAAATLLPREALLLALDELLRRAIVCDDGVARYRFVYDLWQKAAYAALTSARQQLWQERVVQARRQLGQNETMDAEILKKKKRLGQ